MSANLPDLGWDDLDGPDADLLEDLEEWEEWRQASDLERRDRLFDRAGGAWGAGQRASETSAAPRSANPGRAA